MSSQSSVINTVFEYNLIAVGKLSEPVKNDPDLETTFVVRFDA